MSVRLTVVTANIGRGETTTQARDNIRRVRHGFPDAIIGWQEIDEADAPNEHAILGHIFGEASYRNVAFTRAVPISIPNTWEVVKDSVIITHACEWLARATPDRYIVEVLAKHRGLGAPVRFANGHYPLARLGGSEGQARWDDCHAAWKARAKEWAASGITTLTTRDTNALRITKLHKTERQLLPNSISRISVIPGSVGVKLVGRRNVNLTIDRHDARGVDLLLTD